MDNALQLIKISDIFRQAIKIFKEFNPLYLTFGLIFSGLGVLNNIVFGMLPGSSSTKMVILSAANTFLAGWVTMAIFYATFQVLEKKNVNIMESFAAVGDKYWRYIAVTLTSGVLIAFGFVLLVIPALIIAALFIFADILIIKENAGYMESFTKSFDMVKSCLLKPIGFLLIIILLFFAQGFLTQLIFAVNPGLSRAFEVVLTAFFIPFYMIAQVCLFVSFKEAMPTQD